ncbi:MAG: hypothetical protein Q4B64_02270, partial [Spirochaetales bacterium]|nr:hypothetical protein [Spirochaetales bacterium]
VSCRNQAVQTKHAVVSTGSTTASSIATQFTDTAFILNIFEKQIDVGLKPESAPNGLSEFNNIFPHQLQCNWCSEKLKILILNFSLVDYKKISQ